MAKMVALKDMLHQLLGAKELDQLSEWEDNFVVSIGNRIADQNGDTDCLSEKQANKLEEVWRRHFGT